MKKLFKALSIFLVSLGLASCTKQNQNTKIVESIRTEEKNSETEKYSKNGDDNQTNANLSEDVKVYLDGMTNLSSIYDGKEHSVQFRSKSNFSVTFNNQTVNSENNGIDFLIKNAKNYKFTVTLNDKTFETEIIIKKSSSEFEVYDLNLNKVALFDNLEEGDYKIVSNHNFKVSGLESILNSNNKYEVTINVSGKFEVIGESLDENYEDFRFVLNTKNNSLTLNTEFDEQRGVPKGYYDLVNLTYNGEDFRKNLSEIINDGFVHCSYDRAYDIIAESDAALDDPSYVICMYSGQYVKATNHSAITGYNREHTWAKSHGFKKDVSSNPYCDCHHLRTTWCNANSSRNNSDFYEFKEGEKYQEQFGCKYDSSRFEPRDEVKGDVARMMFYMATMYGFDGVYNLTLNNETTTTATDHGNGVFGNLDTLVKWSLEDPVSATEIYRNNVVYKYQKNRNPYIDHPEFVKFAYPESYAKYSNCSINISNVNYVIDKINLLPDNITLDNEQMVNDTYALYDALNWAERELVSNYEKLHEATLIILKLNIIKNIPDKGDITVDFTNNKRKLSKAGYLANNDIVTEQGNVLISFGQVDASTLTLGSNKNKSSQASTTDFGISGPSASLKLDFDIQNIKKVSITCPQVLDNMNYKLYYTTDDTTYNLFAQGELKLEKNQASVINAELDTPVNGKIVLVISPKSLDYGFRVVISSIDIYNK